MNSRASLAFRRTAKRSCSNAAKRIRKTTGVIFGWWEPTEAARVFSQETASDRPGAGKSRIASLRFRRYSSPEPLAMDQNDEENQIEDDEPKSLPHKALLLLVGLLVAVFVFHYGVKTFRNTNYRDLSERFIRSNTFI